MSFDLTAGNLVLIGGLVTLLYIVCRISTHLVKVSRPAWEALAPKSQSPAFPWWTIPAEAPEPVRYVWLVEDNEGWWSAVKSLKEAEKTRDNWEQTHSDLCVTITRFVESPE